VTHRLATIHECEKPTNDVMTWLSQDVPVTIVNEARKIGRCQPVNIFNCYPDGR